MLRRNHGRSFHSKESFLILLSIGNGGKMFLLAPEICLSQIICLMLFTRHFLFMTSVQILFGRYANTGAQKQTLCIPRTVRFLFLYWTAIAFLGLPFSEFLYDEVISSCKELKNNMRISCTHLFAPYHLLRRRVDCELTVEEWIAFWFHGPIKYQAPMTPDCRSRVLVP